VAGPLARMRFLFTHLTLSIILAVLAIILHSTITGDGIASAITSFRTYVLVNLYKDTGTDWQKLWFTPGDPCQAMTNLTAEPSRACLATRLKLQTTILTASGCAAITSPEYASLPGTARSQSCTLIARLVAGLAYNATNPTTPSMTYVAGKNLVDGANPLATSDRPWEYLNTALTVGARYLMHNPFQASVLANSYSVQASAIHLQVSLAILCNMIMLFLKPWEDKPDFLPSLPLRLSTCATFTFLLVTLLVYFLQYTGMRTLTVIVYVPALVQLVWYDMMLPPSTSRPFLHPAMFTVIYVSVTILALLYSGVANNTWLVIEALKAAGVAQMYMGLCWYYLGLWEKQAITHVQAEDKTLDGVASLYRTKGALLSVVLSTVVMALVPFFTWLAPYNYNNGAPFMSTMPVILVVVSIASLWVMNASAGVRRVDGVLSVFCALIVVYGFALAMVSFTEFLSVNLGDSSKWLLTSNQYALNSPTLQGQGLASF
jgi:hypothetical protein